MRPDRIRKSVGAENTFSNDLSELEAMKTASLSDYSHR